MAETSKVVAEPKVIEEVKPVVPAPKEESKSEVKPAAVVQESSIKKVLNPEKEVQAKFLDDPMAAATTKVAVGSTGLTNPG